MMKLPFVSFVAVVEVAVASSLLSLSSIAVAQARLPPEQYQGMVAFRTGGVGQGEAHAMEAAAANYPLQVEFAKRQDGENAFLAGVRVTILNQDGRQVLTTTTDGPFLLAKLPAGRYTISAESDHAIQEQHVSVPSKGTRHVVFIW